MSFDGLLLSKGGHVTFKHLAYPPLRGGRGRKNLCPHGSSRRVKKGINLIFYYFRLFTKETDT